MFQTQLRPSKLARIYYIYTTFSIRCCVANCKYNITAIFLQYQYYRFSRAVSSTEMPFTITTSLGVSELNMLSSNRWRVSSLCVWAEVSTVNTPQCSAVATGFTWKPWTHTKAFVVFS